VYSSYKLQFTCMILLSLFIVYYKERHIFLYLYIVCVCESCLLIDLCSRYDVIVDVAPQVKWVPENGYKNLKIVVEIDSDIDAQRASDQELRRRHKSIGLLRIVTDRGLQVSQVNLV
jgi:hypothetical protein